LAGSFINQITTGKKGTVVWPSVGMIGGPSAWIVLAGSLIKLRPEKKVQLVVWLPYTICNTHNILFLLCLYLKRGNKLNIGIVWFEGKAPSQTSKTCLPMVELFAGPSSMAMGNQPMPSRYPLHKRLSEGGVRGFLLFDDLAEKYYF
jgi:hypothetical protein